MINDFEWIFSEAQSPVTDPSITPLVVTFAVGNGFGANVHRQSVATANIGLIDFAGGDGDVFFFWYVTNALTSGGAATVDVQLVSSASPTLSSPTVHRSTGALAFNAAALAVGSTGVQNKWRLDAGQLWKEYIGVRFVIATAALTAGKFTAVMANRVDTWRAYASGMSLGT